MSFGVSHPESTFILNADEHDVMMFMEEADEHTQSRKQILTFDGVVLRLYVALLLQKLFNMHNTACDRYPLCSDDSLFTKVPHINHFFVEERFVTKREILFLMI